MTARKAIDVIDFKQRPMLFGPDVASPLYSGYFLDVLKFMPPYGVLDGVTYHHFYDQATMANPEYSYDALVLDKFIGMLIIRSLVINKQTNKPITQSIRQLCGICLPSMTCRQLM